MKVAKVKVKMKFTQFHFGNKSNEAYKVQINVNECEIAMEIDTGASVSIMSEDTYKEYKSKFRIEPTSAKLEHTWGEQIPVIGRAIVNVNYKESKTTITIVKRKGPNLLGRDWLNKLQLDWKDIFSVVGSDNQSRDLNVILEANKEVFKDELGTVKGMKAKIYVDESAVPKYFKARPLPYALKDKVEKELERLEKEGQIQQVEFSDWAAPIVPVVKENGSIRICGDYKVTVNAVSKLDNYPIPKTEDLYATLGGGQEYTKLDLNQAYQQIELDEDSKRFKRIGIRLKKQKCVFMAEEVVYLGFKINKHGIYPVESKVEAIDKAPSPTNVTELKAYLGMLNYYNRFLANLSHLLKPLHVLLQKDTKWSWEKEQEKAFIESKQLLKSASVLVHFDPKKKLILACDASPYGLGAVLSHKMDDGSDKPIAYTSRTLTSAEKNYSVLEKESLAIIFGIKKFHQYLYGHPVTIITDHKPLIGALTLAAYEYTIVYKEGSLNGNADGLSRLPLKTNIEKTPTPGDTILLMEHLATTPVDAKQIQKWTRKDTILSMVLRYILNGWPSKCPNEEIRPYHSRKNELSSQDGCILWGGRVIIPQPGREAMLNELHQGHPGITRMKSLARSYIWWPGMDNDLELTVVNCYSCQENRKLPAEAPLHPWEYPSHPWSRIHIDFAGPFMNKSFLIMVDAYSKWIDIHVMNSTTSEATIAKLEQTFATHGLCDLIISDNGAAFTSKEFADYVKSNGIEHRTSAPWHPASNGCAERAVQSFKEGMKKIKEGTIQEKLNRITPQTTTGLAPSELLMKRKLKSRLDLVFPNIEKRVQERQQKQKHYHDKKSVNRQINVGQGVFARNFAIGSKIKWIPGEVIKQSGPLSFHIKLQDGRVIRRHIDHIRVRNFDCTNNENEEKCDNDSDLFEPEITIPISTPETEQPQIEKPSNMTEQMEPRYPKRIRKEPSHLKDFVLK
ncbi:unnamed protein product [Mytilus edulis]|uniref:Integrase catalytic domain-containing protein n=1 Tax=Mytilus edulis TaxID=6550 RepID=A0A8S3TWK9_MYTED|nr:unnamed protein product [Mytilus edulis]